MNKGERIYIERVGNGFVVRPVCDNNTMLLPDSIRVFNDLGYASQMRDDSNVPSLLVFIQDHFYEAKP